MSSEATAAPSAPHPYVTAFKLWLTAYRTELVLFGVTFLALSMFSGQRFLRQSEAPHFVYQAKAFLEGRLDIDPQVLPNIEDWACVRQENGVPTRCAGPLQPGDRWFSSFPAFPALVMLPFVAINGYQLNDTSFGVFIAALAVALFHSLLRVVTEKEGLDRPVGENTALALVLCFGSVFFYCAIRGEVWFSAEVMGVALSCLYARNALQARRPVLAGLFFSMAVLTRTPLLFTGIFFVLEARRAAKADFNRKLGLFAAGAAPLGLLGAWFNVARFGSPAEFGHRFFYNNRVNLDIDTYGLFHPHYLMRNIEAAFLKLPKLHTAPFGLEYDPHGLSLLLTLPLLVLLLAPKLRPALWKTVLVTVACCALPGLLYQNDGYMQFGFRFSLDYTPWLLLAFALSGYRLRTPSVAALAGLGVLVNFWGAVAFRGYTEYVRNW